MMADDVADWRAGDILAGDRLVRQHEALITRIARRYVTTRCELDDLVQVGRLAMLRAATQHNAELGDLTAYATSKIRGAASKYMLRSRCSFALSHKLRDMSDFRLYEARLDAPVSAGDTRTMHDTLPAAANDSPDVDLDALLDSLPPAERDVIARLYGPEPETLAEIGASRGVSKQAVHAISARAMTRLRATARAKATAQRT